MRSIRRGIFLGIGLMAMVGQVWAGVKTFRTAATDDRNQVKFVSEASVETVSGTTREIYGFARLDLDDLPTAPEASFEVNLASLKTGIALRDQHMRENHLETEHYPNAVFTLKKFVSSDNPKLESGGRTELVAEGDLLLHGITKTYQIPLTIARQNSDRGDILTVTGEWTVKLGDHEIPRPQFLFLRLAEEQKISVTVVLTESDS